MEKTAKLNTRWLLKYIVCLILAMIMVQTSWVGNLDPKIFRDDTVKVEALSSTNTSQEVISDDYNGFDTGNLIDEVQDDEKTDENTIQDKQTANLYEESIQETNPPQYTGEQYLPYEQTWDNDYNPTATVVAEVDEKRTLTDKHFLMSDGSYTLMSFAENIHYFDGEKYEEIDNTLVKTAENTYRNTANKLVVEMPESYTNSSKTSVSIGGYSISFKLRDYVTGAVKKATVNNLTEKQIVKAKNDYELNLTPASSLKYEFNDNNVVLEQIIHGSNLKENIIVKSPQEEYIFEFDIFVAGLSLQLQDDGNIYAYNSNNEIVMTIPKGYMMDAGDNFSNDVEYELTENENGYLLTVIPDEEWIEDTTRVFPVTIDPSITTISPTKYGYRFGSFTSGNSEYLLQGNDDNHMTNLDVFCFVYNLPALPTDAIITNAALTVNTTSSDGIMALLYASDTSWAGSNTFTNVGNTKKFYFDDNTSTGSILPDDQSVVINNLLEFNVTRSIKGILEYGEQNYGFVITQIANTIGNSALRISISTPPNLQIAYRSGTGIESYWDYATYGTANDSIYVNKYNNQATVIHGDISTGGEMPISIQHIYMDTYNATNFNIDNIFAGMNFGLGWKLNYQQIIRQRSINGHTEYEYFDADGTNHRFIPSGSAYKDEDGLGLTLTYIASGSYYTISDKNSNKMYFDWHGRMYKIEGANGNVTNIVYGNGNQPTVAGLKITQINDRKGSESIYRVVNFQYDSDGYLTKLTYQNPNGSAVPAETTFTYSNSQLIAISSHDGSYSQYSYGSNGKLKLVQDEKDYAIIMDPLTIDVITTVNNANVISTSAISYNGRRVTENFWEGGTLFEVRGREELLFLNGITYSITPKNGQSFVNYNQSYPNNYLTNNFVVANVYDSYGRSVSSYICGSEITTTVDRRFTPTSNEDTLAKNNKIAATASYDSNIVNYVKNSGIEYADANGSPNNWSKYSSGTSQYFNISQSSKYKYDGKYSLELFSAQPVNGIYTARQSVTLPIAGSYLLSAYVKVSDTLMFCEGGYYNDYGAFIGVNGSYSGDLITNDMFENNNGFKLILFRFSTSANNITVNLDLGLKNCSGFAYFDCIQIFRDDYGYTDKYNSAENQGFEEWTGVLPDNWDLWVETGDTAANYIEKSPVTFSGSNSVKFAGQANGSANLYQRVAIPESEYTTAYTVSLWVNTIGRVFLPMRDASQVQLNFRLLDEDGNGLSNFSSVPINLDSPFWYQVSATIIVPAYVKKIEINIQINRSNTILLIDNVSLVQSDIVNLEYDQNGNNTNLNSGSENYGADYNGNDMEISKNGEAEYGIIKDDNGNVITSKNYNRNLQINYTYDVFGRVTSETVSSFASNSKKITSTTTYSEIASDWTQTLENTDSLGFKSISEFSAFYDILERSTSNDGSYIQYTYSYDTTLPNEIKTVTVAQYSAANVELSSAVYTYYLSSDMFMDEYSSIYRSIGMLKSVQMKNGTTYSYIYDKWGNVLRVSLGNETGSMAIIQYSYRSTDGALLSKELVTGYKEYYAYDALGRLLALYKRNTATASAEVAYAWFYSIDNRIVKAVDYENNKIYEYTYDAAGRVIIVAEGDATTGKFNTYFEYVYDAYGNVVRKNTIIKSIMPLAGSGNFDGMTAYNLISTSGVYSRVREGLYEYIYIDGVEKIKYTYSSTDPKTSYIVREDNKLNNNIAFPNGSTIIYSRDARGKLTGFNFCDYNTTTALLIRGSYYDIRSTELYYDNGTTDVWNQDYAISAATNGTPTACEDETFNGTTITGIIRAQAYMYTASGNSIIDPKYLQYSGESIAVRYMIRLEEVSTVPVAGLTFGYSDGTYDGGSNVYLDNSKGTDWQEKYIVSDPSKTVTKVFLLWSYSRYVRIGNVSIEVANNAWNTDWVIANQLAPNSSVAVTRQPNATVNTDTPITDIIRVNQSSFYVATVGGTDVYKSLVDPSLLSNGGECITMSYWIKKESAIHTEVYNLCFRYSDGTISGISYIPNDTNWHYYSVTSTAGKVVIGIELRYYHNEWVRIGNVRIVTQGLERKDDRLSGEKLENGNYITYSYDELGRSTESKITDNKGSSTQVLKETYTYLDGSNNNTSYVVASKSVIQGSSTTTTYDYTYNMDNTNLGAVKAERPNPYNIYKVTENGTVKQQYYYNELGQLIREDNAYISKTITYTYDTNNNITSKTEYAYTTAAAITGSAINTYTYSYSTQFLDRLTNFNGESIVYNAIGQPTTYRDMSMSWAGYNLSQLIKNGITYSYAYNSDGLRLSKTSSSGLVTEYLRSGTKLIRETRGTDVIWYLYDDDGMVGFEYNGVTYYFVRNLQGDVMKLVTTSGETVAVYNYDAWGKVVSVLSGTGADITGNLTHIGNINPIRYRSYYYDTETGLYYLNARYYDPATGRFISPDIVAEAGNLYAYCQNDPINRVDDSGYWSWKKFTAGVIMAVTATVAIALSVATLGAATPLAVAVVAGVTLTAGVLTGVNAVATMVEAGTDYNFVRDGVFNEVLGLSDDAYNIYAGATETVAVVGSMILGFYKPTAPSGLNKGSINNAVKNTMKDSNKMNHILGNSAHNLGNLTKKQAGQLMKDTLYYGNIGSYKGVQAAT